MLVMDGNKSYLLSYTAFFAEKEYLLSVNLHQAVEVQKDYTLSTPVYSSYDGLIMGDIKEGTKAKYQGSIFYPQKADISIVDADSPSELISSSLRDYMALMHETLQTTLKTKDTDNVQEDIITIAREAAQLIAADVFGSAGNPEHLVEAHPIKQGFIDKDLEKAMLLLPLSEGEFTTFEQAATFNYGTIEPIHVGVRDTWSLGVNETLQATEIFSFDETYFAETTEGVEALLSTKILSGWVDEAIPSERKELVYLGELLATPSASISDLLADNHKLSSAIRLLEIMYGEYIVESIKAEFQNIVEQITEHGTFAHQATNYLSVVEEIETGDKQVQLDTLLQRFTLADSSTSSLGEWVGIEESIVDYQGDRVVEMEQEQAEILGKGTSDTTVLKIEKAAIQLSAFAEQPPHYEVASLNKDYRFELVSADIELAENRISRLVLVEEEEFASVSVSGNGLLESGERAHLYTHAELEQTDYVQAESIGTPESMQSGYEIAYLEPLYESVLEDNELASILSTPESVQFTDETAELTSIVNSIKWDGEYGTLDAYRESQLNLSEFAQVAPPKEITLYELGFADTQSVVESQLVEAEVSTSSVTLDSQLDGYATASRYKRKTRISFGEKGTRNRKVKAHILFTEQAVSLGSPNNEVVTNRQQERWLITGKPFAWNNKSWAKTR